MPYLITGRSRQSLLRPAAIVLLLAAASCVDTGTTLVELSGETMGTTYTVKLGHLPTDVDVNQLQLRIDAVLETVNDQMSTYRPDSELSRFNRHDATDWFGVSTDTAFVVEAALQASRQSDGAFDPTVGPLVDLWNFGPGRKAPEVPSEDAIQTAAEHVGYGKVEVRIKPPALRKLDPAVQLDLSGIAKGFGVDQVAELLDVADIESYMVEIGGEVRAKGTKPSGSPWSIGVVVPRPDPAGVKQTVQRALPLRNSSLATSGDYRNYFEQDGKRYSHTIDPRTGYPVEHQLASVSVVGDTCTVCDALATTLMVLGPEDGYNLAEEHDVAALFIVRSGDELTEKATTAYVQRFGSP